MRGGIYPSCTPREDENLLEALASLLKSFSLPSSHPPNSVGGSGPYSESPLGQALPGQRLSLSKSRYMLPHPESQGCCSPGSSQDNCVVVLATSQLRPLPSFLPLSVYHWCVLSWPQRTSVSHPLISLTSSFVAFFVLSLSVSVSCFVSVCLHPPPPRPLGILKATWEQKSLLGFPTCSPFWSYSSPPRPSLEYPIRQ